MKTLTQIEPRTPLAGGTTTVTISTAGSYYLTGNITVASGAGVSINVSNVTLDLNGFTISSTDSSDASMGIDLNGNLSNINIHNGTIKGGATDSNGTISGPGFFSGVASGQDYYVTNSSVSDLTVANLRGYGLELGRFGLGDIVENCVVNTVGYDGIVSGIVRSSYVTDCGGEAIFADEVSNSYASTSTASSEDAIDATMVSNSYGISNSTVGSPNGIECSVAENSYGQSTYHAGISCFAAHNCRGFSTLNAGINSTGVVTSSYGSSTNYEGISATDVENSYGTGSEGIYANTASGCTGYGGTGDGIYVEDTAVGCYGSSSSSYGLFSNNTATGCVGFSGGLVGLQTKNSAENCTGTSSVTSGSTANATGLYTQVALNCVGYSQFGTGLIATATATGCYGQTASTAGGVYGISGNILNVCHGVIGNGSANSVNSPHNINSF